MVKFHNSQAGLIVFRQLWIITKRDDRITTDFTNHYTGEYR